MKKTKFIAIIVTLILVFAGSACKKDKDEINIPLIDYLTIEEMYEDFGNKGVESWKDSIYMEYNSSDQLIKLTGYYDVMEFQYDSEGRVTRIDQDYVDVTKRPSATYFLFTWEGNTVTAREYYAPEQPSSRKYVYTLNTDDQITKLEVFYEDVVKSEEAWVLTEYVDFTWTNDNITMMEYYGRGRKSTESSFNGFPSPFTSKSDSDFGIEIEETGEIKAIDDFILGFKVEATYDNKVNPFVKYPGLGIFHAGEMAHIFLSKNNVTSYTETEYYYEEADTETYTVTNEYNQQNLPVKIEHSSTYEYEPGSGYTYTETWEIAYL